MGVFVLGLVIGAVVGGRLARNVDGFRGSRGALAKAVSALSEAQSKAGAARSKLTRFVVLLVLAAVAVAYGWMKGTA